MTNDKKILPLERRSTNSKEPDFPLRMSARMTVLRYSWDYWTGALGLLSITLTSCLVGYQLFLPKITLAQAQSLPWSELYQTDSSYAKAEYFDTRQMWADVLKQAYSVDNPSMALTDFIEITFQQFCSG